jgi:ADP-glucose pyrophosphorylase
VEVGSRARVQPVIVDEGVKITRGMIIGYDRAEDAKRLPVSPHGIVVVSDS